jgi:hypothetical protein
MSNPTPNIDFLPPFPDTVSDSTENPSVPVTPPATSTTIDLQKYMELYADYIRVQDENVKLRRKMITLEEDLKKWTTEKASKKTKLQGEELKNAIVEIILNSSLNIESIPDDVERELYSFLINQISNAAGTVSCFRKFFVCG